jgi:hypothetical protein
MFSHVKSTTLRTAELQNDKIESLQGLEPGPKGAFRPKKFAIFGTKIAESTEFFCESKDCLEPELPIATEILTRILQNNLNTYNHLINYNYKTRIMNHDDEIKDNRLNFLLGMRKSEKIFSIRPASLTDLNERLGRIYAPEVKQTRISAEGGVGRAGMIKSIYNISKKQQKSNSAFIQRNKLFGSESSDSLRRLSEGGVKKLGFVDFSDQLDVDSATPM